MSTQQGAHLQMGGRIYFFSIDIEFSLRQHLQTDPGDNPVKYLLHSPDETGSWNFGSLLWRRDSETVTTSRCLDA
jgi:hypothetical protein